MYKKLLFALLLLPLLFAGGDVSKRLSGAICNLYEMLRDLIVPVVVLAIVVAAIAYAGGNVLGQEIGAKAKSWAINIIIYSVIGILIFVAVPWIIGQVVPELNIESACR